GIVGGDLQKDAGAWSALVGLTGGMQIAWPEAHAGGNVLAVANRGAQLLQRRTMRLVLRNEGQRRHVGAGLDPGGKRRESSVESAPALRSSRALRSSVNRSTPL